MRFSMAMLHMTGRSEHDLFAGREESPVYRTVEPAGGVGARQQMRIGRSAAKIRPYVVCAVLRGVKFDPKNYKSFMDLQVPCAIGISLRAFSYSGRRFLP